MKTLMILAVCAACGFAETPARPAPASDAGGANLPMQKIGPNDLVAISVYDSPELTRTVRIGADGMLRLPMLQRRIKAENLMPNELEAAIAEALKAENLLVDPFVTVTVAEYHSRPISVAGAVKTPLTFQAIGPVTLLEAITRAGGLGPEAGAEILVSRHGAGTQGAALVQRIAVKALIDAADPTVNVTLNGGEEIRVPEVGRIYVIGNVRKPGAYPVQDASEATVLKVLAVAEGLAPNAAKDAYVYRREGGSGGKNEITVPLRQIMDRKASDTPLMANDILYVPDSRGRRLGLAVLERVLMFGSTAGATALIYGTVR